MYFKKAQRISDPKFSQSTADAIVRCCPNIINKEGPLCAMDLPVYSSFLICFKALFSNRETCACEIPISADTSIWVLP